MLPDSNAGFLRICNMADQQRPTPPSKKPNRNTSAGANGAGGMRFGRGLMGWLLFIGLVLMMVYLLNNSRHSQVRIAESEVIHNLDKVRSLVLDTDEMSGTFNMPVTINGQQVTDFVASIP